MKEKVAVIGAGFYGLMLSTFLAKKYDVTIFEEASEVMTKASNLCQARIHTGMMYPRHIRTAISCLMTFRPFMTRFSEAIVDNFTSIYAVAKNSNISGEEFYETQKGLGQHITKIKNELFNPDLVSDVYSCEEFTFDPLIIRNVLLYECEKEHIKIELNTRINKLDSLYKKYSKIFLCNYEDINRVLTNSYLSPIPMKSNKFEKIFYRDNLGELAVCVVDGNYFNTMCLPDRYKGIKTITAPDLSICKVGDMWDTLVKRVKKFIPDIAMVYDHSQIGYKSVCTDRDTFRTCLINQQNYRGIDIYSILGGKITNVFNMFDDLKSTL